RISASPASRAATQNLADFTDPLYPQLGAGAIRCPWSKVRVESQSRRTTMFAMSGLTPIAAVMLQCRDRSRSAMCGRLRVGKDFLHARRLGRCSHVFGLFVRFTRPLAIMPSADQVPVKSPHSRMQWHMWVVLIAGSTGSALRAVRPANLHITPGYSARSR